MADKIRTVHYLNQFFGGVGGEEQGDLAPQWFDGSRGPGQLIEQQAPDITIVGTLVAGDNYMADHADEAAAKIADAIEQWRAAQSDRRIDLVLAGPAFNAGRYGMACGAVCAAVQERLGIPAATALYDENPAVDIYRRTVTIARADADVMGMNKAVAALIAVARKLAAGEPVSAAVDGTIARGLRENYFSDRSGAQRAVALLQQKLAGELVETEYKMPVFDHVAPAPAVADLASTTLALVTSGGIVPRGNPDGIESASASRYGEYSIKDIDALTADSHQTVHGGYDPTYANADPNRVLPLDAVRTLEREGRIGRLWDSYFATVGNATSVAKAREFGQMIATKLVNVGVQAVILTST